MEMRALGFRFEPFGEGAVRISAVPETVTDPETALLAALHALAGGKDLAKALACKGSTRFGENLSREEMEVLLKEWFETNFREMCTPEWKNSRPVLPCLAEGKRHSASRIDQRLEGKRYLNEVTSLLGAYLLSKSATWGTTAHHSFE